MQSSQFMQRTKVDGDLALGIAVGLAMIPSGLFTIASVYLLLGGSISPTPARVIFGVVAAVATALAWKGGRSWISPVAVAVLAVVSAMAANVVIDLTYDGQQYHHDAIRALADGWNPYRQAFQFPAPLQGHVEDGSALWAGHYPQAGWIAAAVAVASGGSIEAAKSAPLFLALALFFAAYGTLVTSGFDPIRAAALSALMAGNPVILVQLFSRMNDGQLCASFGLMIMFIIVWLRDRRIEFAVAAAGIAAYALNLKFSALPLFAMLSTLVVGGVALVKGRLAAFRISFFLFFTGAAGVFLLGAHPYITNVFEKHNPFYPIMGVGAVDIMKNNRPAGFSEISPAQRLIRSYFSTTSSSYDGSAHLKIPFSIYKSELYNAGGYDTRLGGFGPLFSAAVLIAVGLGAWIAFAPSRAWDRLALAGTALLAFYSLSLPEAWWARYVPQLWWVPVIAAGVALMSIQRYLRICGWALTATLLLNASIVGASWARCNGLNSWRVQKQLAMIASAGKPVCVFLGASHSRLDLLHNVGVQVHLQNAPLPGSCHPTPLLGTWPYLVPSYCVCADHSSAVEGNDSYDRG